MGIDYSGAKTPTSRLSGIQVYSAGASGELEIVRSLGFSTIPAQCETEQGFVPTS